MVPIGHRPPAAGPLELLTIRKRADKRRSWQVTFRIGGGPKQSLDCTAGTLETSRAFRQRLARATGQVALPAAGRRLWADDVQSAFARGARDGK